MRRQGRISEWRDEQGFGFITPNGGGEKIFLHIKAFQRPARRPLGKELVDFHLSSDDKGRPRAERVKYARIGRTPAPAAAGARRRMPRVGLALGFFAALAVLVLVGKLPWLIAGGYAALSVATFVAYALDKSAAEQGRWRTPESTLQLLALIGGWPGALLAQQWLRHKSAKREFLALFWTVALLNLASLGWLLSSPAGFELLQSLSNI